MAMESLGCNLEKVSFSIESLHAKVGRFMLRLKVVYYEPQNKEPQNIEVKNIVLFLLKTSAVRISLFDIRHFKTKTH
jgi:hypothetical protein